jgi:hypothetical protein
MIALDRSECRYQAANRSQYNLATRRLWYILDQEVNNDANVLLMIGRHVQIPATKMDNLVYCVRARNDHVRVMTMFA